MKKLGIVIAVIFGGLFLLYFTGPKRSYEPVSSTIPDMDIPLEELTAFIASNERMVEGIKEGNESRIIWADSIRRTPYAIVYLHGFSASPMESSPVHEKLAAKYGCNLYIPRLSQHGLSDDDAFLELTPESLMASAREAVAIGSILGDNVILMSCSTGGTLSIYLASENPDLIAAQILYSPNIEVFDQTLKIVNDPWGETILKSIVGDYRENTEDIGTPKEQFWTMRYRSEGLIALQDLLEQTMTQDVFEKIDQPYFLGYYYKNEEEQDNVVSVPAMLEFDKATATDDDQKRVVAFPNVGNHVIASELTSEDIESVFERTSEFMQEVLQMQAVY